MYAIVKFVEEDDSPGIVCTHWINKEENMCFYPNVKTNEARDRILRKLTHPAKDWTSCRIKILHKYNSFAEASIYLPKAEETSNLESEADDSIRMCRKKLKRHMKFPGEDLDEEPQVPVQKSKKPHNETIDPYPKPYENSLNSCQNIQIQDMYDHAQLENIQTVINQKQLDTSSAHLGKSPACPSTIQTVINQKELDTSSAHLGKSPVRPSTSQTVINGRLVAWMADISAKVQDLGSKMDLILKNQAVLLEQRHKIPEGFEKNEDLEEILGNLPVTDDNSFVELNKKVAEDSHLQNLLVKVLISVGGKDLRSHTHNMLRRILTDDVAELYTLSGKSTLKNTVKKSFVATEVSKAMFCACRRVFKDLATEVKVKEAVGDWLNQAKVRKIRRMQRHEKNMENAD